MDNVEKKNELWQIHILVPKEMKMKWQNSCLIKKISLTSFIIDSVENRLMADEKNRILAFIDKQDNIFAKIENNINQIARYVNTQQFVDQTDIKVFNERLSEIASLKLHQNELMEKIFRMLLEKRKEEK